MPPRSKVITMLRDLHFARRVERRSRMASETMSETMRDSPNGFAAKAMKSPTTVCGAVAGERPTSGLRPSAALRG